MRIEQFNYEFGEDNYNDNIIDIINKLSTYKNINTLSMEIVLNDDKPNSKESILVDKKSLEVIKINGKDINYLHELITLLNIMSDLNIVMERKEYDKFRLLFSNLYIKAYFNPYEDITYSLDTDEINQILKYQHLNYQIKVEYTNLGILYSLHKI